MIEGHTVTGYFYNPNIHPADEYERRRETAKKAAKHFDIDFVEGPYDRENWFTLVKGTEYEPEGGERCKRCFRMRLEKTYEYLKKQMFDRFTTTLTTSPLKDAAAINEIGRQIGGEKFISRDFKKKDGFKRAMEIAKELDLYHQDYCGCIYSQEEKIRQESKKG